MTTAAYAFLRNEQTQRTSAHRRRVAQQVGAAIGRLERRRQRKGTTK